MAKILTFRTGEMRRDESGAASERATAEVIVFPGVRYEHWDDAHEPRAHLQPGVKKPSREQRQRDVLELAE